MVTLSYGVRPGRMLTLPTIEDVKRAMQDRAVAITAVVCGSLLAACFLAALTFLAYTGRGTEALTGAGMLAFLGALVSIIQRLKTVEKHVTPEGGQDGRPSP